MSSRDNRSGSGRTMKILSREDRDNERGREDRDRDRDRDSDRRRRDDRDRDRRRDDRDRDRDRDRRKERDSEKPVQGPIVLLKRPDTKSSGPSDKERGEQGSSSAGDTSTSKHGHGPTSILQRSGKKDQESYDSPNVEKGKSSGPPPITEILKPAYTFPGGKAMTLVDSNMKMRSWKAFDYDANNLPGNLDYLVVTVIGRPKVGKSTILSYLAGEEKFGSREIFRHRAREQEMQSSIFISSDQIVLIEMSSVYNQSATNDLIPLVSQQGVLEVSNVTWNLRLVRWALSVSHVVLIVSENVFDPNVFQLLNSAEIIHSMESALGEGSYPELLFVCNKANLELLDSTEVIDEFQKHFNSVISRTPRISQNYFVLPHTKYDMECARFSDFKKAILEFNRYNRAPFISEKEDLAKLTQKHNIQDWYQNACRLWDEMNLPSFFSSYVKLLP